METLDISNLKEKGQELVKAIEQNVKDTQSVIVRPYPSMIWMRRDQYDDLTGLSGMIDMTHGTKDEIKPEDRLWRTKYNVMEVRVKHEQ